MRRFHSLKAVLLICLAMPAAGGTRIRDTVYYAVSGQTAEGQVTIAWPSFKSGTRTVVAGRMVLHLVGGVVAADLEPNDAAIPAGTSYTVSYQLREGSRSTEWWVVPTSAGVKTISDVRVTTIPTPSTAINLTQIGQGGATAGQCVVWSGTAWEAGACSGAILATQAEAEAGTENTHQMTPLRSAQAIAALAGGDIAAVGNCASGSCYQAAAANYVYAGPATGAAAPAALRALVSADIPANAADTSGTAAKATALAANGANCSAGNYPLGVDASGAVENCTAAATGDVGAVGDCAGGDCHQAATANYVYAGPATGAAAPAALRALVSADIPAHTHTITRQFVFLLGADNGALLVDGDDQKQIWWNNLGSTATITKVGCICDASTPLVNLQRDDGSPADILASNLICSTTGATTVTFASGENVIADGQKIDFVMVSAGGTVKRLTLTGTYTVVQ